MKYLLLLLFLNASAVRAQELSGLVVKWKMENICELKDESSSSINGVLNDISFAPNKDNIPNAAFLFDLNSSYITLGAVDQLKLADDKSISFSVYPVATGTNRVGTIFSYGSAINIRYEEQSGVSRLNIIFGNTSYMTANLVQNQWQSVTITFKKDFSTTTSKAYFYVNGAPVTSAEQNKSTHDFNKSIALIGPPDQNTLTNGFRGRLDDMRIYNRTLSDAEVLNLVLPVKLEFFRGKRIKDIVELNWRTTVEENVSHFNLQKSLDGISFQPIQKIEAGKFNYLAYDVLRFTYPLAFYRLQIIDRDGKMEYSNVIRVDTEETDATSEIKLFPNPAEDRISFTGIKANATVTITSNTGAVVKHKQALANNTIDISDLKPGLYFISFFDGDKKMIAKFIKR
ncbi:MAG: T9SS type A sorting domain-containing protein [Chitinophagaceae bacterium]|nr:T9SS type A sorting domain-containing protein [Chitinophagaceae bacterium]